MKKMKNKFRKRFKNKNLEKQKFTWIQFSTDLNILFLIFLKNL